MSAFWRFFLLILFLHLALGWCLNDILGDQPGLFILAEIGLLITFLFSLNVYSSFRKPLKLIQSGIDALADQDFTVKFTPTSSNEMNQLIETYNQMIDKIREERISLAEQHYFLEQLIEASPNGLILLDYDHKVSNLNQSAVTILEQFGYEENTANEFVEKYLLKDQSGEGFILSPKGFQKYKVQPGTFIHRGFSRKFFSIQDLSKDLLETEKKAYGKVIRMMAHEVNNSIGAINSILQTTHEVLADEMKDTEHEDLVNGLSVAIERNQLLNRFMRNFADVIKLPPPELESYSINKLLKRVAQLMQFKAESQGITIEMKLPDYEVMVKMDPKQMEQAIINIIKNAMEAILDKGTIEIRMYSNPTKIEIADNGSGIDSQNCQSIIHSFSKYKNDWSGNWINAC